MLRCLPDIFGLSLGHITDQTLPLLSPPTLAKCNPNLCKAFGRETGWDQRGMSQPSVPFGGWIPPCFGLPQHQPAPASLQPPFALRGFALLLSPQRERVGLLEYGVVVKRPLPQHWLVECRRQVLPTWQRVKSKTSPLSVTLNTSKHERPHLKAPPTR